MEEARRYNRETLLLACLVAWMFGIGTGIVLRLTYGGAPPPPADSGMTFTTIPDSAPLAQLISPPPDNEWVVAIHVPYDPRDCPRIHATELAIREGETERTVFLRMRVTNDNPATACTISADAVTLRDGDGHVYRHDSGDVHVAALGAKWARFTFHLPRSLGIAQLVVRFPNGHLDTQAIDLDRPVRRPHPYPGRR